LENLNVAVMRRCFFALFGTSVLTFGSYQH